MDSAVCSCLAQQPFIPFSPVSSPEMKIFGSFQSGRACTSCSLSLREWQKDQQHLLQTNPVGSICLLFMCVCWVSVWAWVCVCVCVVCVCVCVCVWVCVCVCVCVCERERERERERQRERECDSGAGGV